MLAESGWHTALFGMQHETSYPVQTGLRRVRRIATPTANMSSNSATRWLAEPAARPFLLTAGFFETHRPYPRDRYDPADADTVARARLPARHR